MVVTVDRLDHNGRGICYINNKITFVENALPNEELDIEIVSKGKKYNIGRIKKIIKASSNRIKSKCPYFYSCGGCNLFHMKYEDELKFKEDKIKNIMKKYANIDSSKIKEIIYKDELNYRNKATFQVKEIIGYYREKSYEIVPIDYCLIVDNRINNILNEIKKYDLNNIIQILVRVGINSSMVVFKTVGDIDNNIKNLNVDNILYFDNEYHLIKGKDFIIDQIGKYKYQISPDSFFQVNKNCTYELYNKVKEYVCSSNKLLDLYCGTGSIGIFLSDICNKIVGVEINSSAIKNANYNKELNLLDNIEFVCSDTSFFDEIDDYDTVIVDPPRSGLDDKTKNYLKKINAQKIVYISCDPMTLARDLKNLSDKYDVEEITPVNMFPKTYHVECVCVLKLK